MNRLSKLMQNKFVLWSFLFCFLALNFQNCGPNFSATSTNFSSAVAAQASNVITPVDSNLYKPGQNLSFTYRKDLMPEGPLVWSNLLNSGSNCQEISASNADPYIVNCSGKGVLTVTLVINSGGSNVVGPLSSSFVVNDGVPRSSNLVPMIITSVTGNWNTPGQTLPPFSNLNVIASQNVKLSTTVPAHTYQFKADPKAFLANAAMSWSFTAPNCMPSAGTSTANNFNVTCSADSRIDVDLQVSGSDPTAGPFTIAPMHRGGMFSISNDSFTVDPVPATIAMPVPINTDANYIGTQELLDTNVVFVGQTLRFFNKASDTKQFGLGSDAPCAPTGAIPYTAKDDYSKYVDCKVTKEFGDPAVGSPLSNVYDPNQKFWLIALDGTRLYNQNCKICHVDLNIARNQIGNETLARLVEAIAGKANSIPMSQLDNSYSNHLSRLSNAEKLAIIFALRN
jgi:hypothetical protein